MRLEINSLGQPAERAAHRAALVAHFEAHASQLDDDSRRRLHSNPLRILDTKNPAMRRWSKVTPKLLDFLGADSLAHFDAVRAALDAAGLAYRVNPRMVRGDGLTTTSPSSRWVTDHARLRRAPCAAAAATTACSRQLGGKPAPAIGFGLGIERAAAA